MAEQEPTDRDLTQQATHASKAHGAGDEVRARYQAYLGDTARIVSFDAPGSTGFSSETYLVDVEVDGAIRHEVLRTIPTGETVFQTYDLGLQVACLRQLGDVVPTPEVLAHVEDPAVLGRPFYVMRRIDGRIPDDNPPYTMVGWLKDAPFALQAAVYESGIDVISTLATTTPGEVGLTDVLERPELGGTGLEQQIRWWRDLYDWGREGGEQPTLDAAWEWLDKNRPDDPGRDCVLWGDARVSNMVFGDKGEVAAVLDWEMAGLGPAEIDLAWFLWMDRQFTVVFDMPRLEGFPGEDALIERWTHVTGHPPEHLDWYLIFAGVRFSITLMRVALRSKADGKIPQEADVERNNLGTRLVARELGLPEPGPIGLMG